MSIAEYAGVEPERLWGGTVVALLVAVVVGSLAFPRAVYDGFVWHYFWGPVQADAKSAVCAVREGGATQYLGSASACANAAEPVAYPGYTLVSEVGYVVVLLVALTGVVFLLRRLDVGQTKGFFYALIPFMFFGGALRVVEDVNDAIPANEALVTYPLNTLIISPIIYFTVFAITLGALVVAVTLARRGVVDDYRRVLAAQGVLVLAVTVGYLAYMAATGAQNVTFYPQVLGVTLVFATLTAVITWGLVVREVPSVVAGTGPALAFVVIWGHAVDGAANVVGLDWMTALDAGPNLVPKHPVNAAIVDITGSVLPPSILAVTGDTWPFLLVKLAAATLVVSIFDEQVMEESPRYSILLLVAIVAVGLGPGTRDMLRATFGV
jgi:uncharacterized membrane protein